MTTPPYQTGDHVELQLDSGTRTAVVSAVVAIPAPDPSRRWRLLCRDEADGTSIERPIYCGDDGNGDLIAGRTSTPPTASASA